MIISTEVNSLGDLIREVSSEVVATNSYHWYRGQHDASWDLLPSAFRGPESEAYKRGRERSNMHIFRSRAGIRYQQTPNFNDIAGWISLMQHYGLPTRLLDWTRSPLVAAYFALEKYFYDQTIPLTDACIWTLQPQRLNSAQGFKDITPSISSTECRKEIEPAFYDSAEETEKVQAVMASEADLRIFVQQGAFTVHSTTKALNNLAFEAGILKQLVIPSRFVESMAIQLAICGFRKGDIYPDLQNLAEDMRTYKPRVTFRTV